MTFNPSITIVLMIISAVVLFILDVDTGILVNLKYGVSLVIIAIVAAQYVFLASILEYIYELIDPMGTDERRKKINNKALKTAEGAGSVSIAKSIRVLAHGILLAAVVTVNYS